MHATDVWKGKKIFPRISVDGDDRIHFAVSCRHCEDPLCVKSCISGALHLEDGRICIDKNKCVAFTELSQTCTKAAMTECSLPFISTMVIEKRLHTKLQ